MFIRAYLRASTRDQDADRARDDLEQFASEHGHRIAAFYTENESGAWKDRPELLRLLADAHAGDVLLIEQVDRLSRLTADDWKALRREIDSKGVRVVALDLPTSHAAMQAGAGDDFTARMLDALNGMMLDVLAAVARKDYEDRRRRQRQGIDKLKAEGGYAGRKKDTEKRQKVAELLDAGFSVRKAAELAGCSTYLVQTVKREQRKEEEQAAT